MAEETKNDTQRAPRKAPSVIVNSFPSKGSVDSLLEDNPGMEFVYGAAGLSDAAMKEAGLEAVTKDGTPVMHKKMAIYRCLNTKHRDEVKHAQAEATAMVEQVRDVDREDKTSIRKKPVDKPRENAELK